MVTTVLADEHEKYLSTDPLRNEPVKDSYRALLVDLKSYVAYRRACD